jgi:hypothetical protein
MKKIVHNVSTGEITEVELTAEELAQRTKDAAADEKAKTNAEKAATDKAALLAKLGITADEAALLLA